eukprot:6467677-Amphidinium_carterae.1
MNGRPLTEVLRALEGALQGWRLTANHNRANLKNDGKPCGHCVILGAFSTQGAGITSKTADAAQA